jgi:D-alanyl-D-alanine carboxypeptidase (penicillin-binding protein 5/6)
LKTGHTEEAGFGIVGSAKRGNRRITFVISGLKSAKLRAQEASKITEWAFRDFKAIKIINKSEEIGLLPTWLGDVSKIGLITNKDIYILAKNGEPVKSEAKILYRSYMEAPFDKDSKAPADLIITTPLPNNKSGNSAITFPLYANESVKSGDFLSQFKAASIVLRNYALDLFRLN